MILYLLTSSKFLVHGLLLICLNVMKETPRCSLIPTLFRVVLWLRFGHSEKGSHGDCNFWITFLLEIALLHSHSYSLECTLGACVIALSTQTRETSWKMVGQSNTEAWSLNTLLDQPQPHALDGFLSVTWERNKFLLVWVTMFDFFFFFLIATQLILYLFQLFCSFFSL